MALFCNASVEDVSDHLITLSLVPRPWHSPGTLQLSFSDAARLIVELQLACSRPRPENVK